MDQQNPSYISCTEDEQKDDVLIFFRDTLEKQIEAVVDTISPLYGDDFTQAHCFQCACVRISYEIRTNLSILGEKRGKFCLKIIFRGFLKLLLHLQELLNPHLQKGCCIAPELYPCSCYSGAR